MIVASTIVPDFSSSRFSSSSTLNLGKNPLGELVLLEKMPKAEDRRLIRDVILGQLDAGEATHRLDVVQGVGGLRLRLGYHHVHAPARDATVASASRRLDRVSWAQATPEHSRSQTSRTTPRLMTLRRFRDTAAAAARSDKMCGAPSSALQRSSIVVTGPRDTRAERRRAATAAERRRATAAVGCRRAATAYVRSVATGGCVTTERAASTPATPTSTAPPPRPTSQINKPGVYFRSNTSRARK